jgi:hypothetical protein
MHLTNIICIGDVQRLKYNLKLMMTVFGRNM